MKPILLAEDNEDDILLAKMACDLSGIAHSLHVVRDGEEAMAYLSGLDKFSDRTAHPLPHLLLLDIKMPKLDGHQVLEWVRKQQHLVDLPVVMLTTSDAKSDLERAYALGVNSYLTKGADLAEFTQGMRILLKYWLIMNIRHSAAAK